MYIIHICCFYPQPRTCHSRNNAISLLAQQGGLKHLKVGELVSHQNSVQHPCACRSASFIFPIWLPQVNSSVPVALCEINSLQYTYTFTHLHTHTCWREADCLTCWREADCLTHQREVECLTCQGHQGHSSAWADTGLQRVTTVFGLAILTTPLSRHFTTLYGPSQWGFILCPFFDSLAEFLSQTELPGLKTKKYKSGLQHILLS